MFLSIQENKINDYKVKFVVEAMPTWQRCVNKFAIFFQYLFKLTYDECSL